MPDPTWLISQHIPTNSLAVLYGPYGSYKSFTALDMAMCVATGEPLWGVYPSAQGTAVYLVGEGFGGYKNRLRAWRMDRYGGKHVPKFRPVDCPLDLSTPDGKDVDDLVARLLWLPERPALVVVDTMARYFRGDENSSDTVGEFVAAGDRIRNATKGTVLVVAHTGKDVTRDTRGSNALPSAAHCSWEQTCDKESKIITLKNKKQKDAPEGMTYTLMPTVLTVAPDNPDESLRTSLVLTQGVFTPAKRAEDKRHECRRAVMRSLATGNGNAKLIKTDLKEDYGANFIDEEIKWLKARKLITDVTGKKDVTLAANLHWESLIDGLAE